MPSFVYKAADPAGKIVRGTLEGKNESDVVAQLQDKGCIPINIRPVNGDTRAFSFSAPSQWVSYLSSFFNRVSRKEVLLFTQDLATLLGAGLPLDKALSLLTDVAETELLKNVIKDILKDVQGGSDLSDALSKHPGVFSMFYINMVRAGEMGGVLEPVLQRVAAFLETSQDLREYIVSAMIYPLFLVLVGGISIVVMLTVVIPKFSIIFSDLGQAIPLSTRMLLNTSDLLREFWWVIVLLFSFAWFFTKRYLSTPSGRYRTDKYLLDAPMVGRLVRIMEVARFSRALGTLMNSGVPILKALSLIIDLAANVVVKDGLKTAYERVKEGERLSKPLAETGVFPSLAIQMIAVGEETGKLDSMLLKVAENYEKTLKNLIKRLISLLEPAMILIMGLVVGFIVISMLMAVFSMNDLPF